MLLPILYLLLLTATLHAQPARLVMVAHKNYGEAIADTTWLKYKTGNMATGNFDDMYEGRLLYDTIIEHVRGRHVRTEVLHYNKQKQIDSSVLTALLNTRMMECGKDLYTYDADGHKRRHIALYKKNETADWDTAFMLQWEYDKGNIVSQADTIKEGLSEMPMLTLYAYDDKGRLLSSVLKWRTSKGWAIRSKGMYMYDSAGNNTVYENWGWNDTGYILLYKSINTYQDGRRTSYRYQSGDTALYSPSSENGNIFTYDMEGRPVCDSQFSYIGNSYKSITRVVYAYKNDTTLITTFGADTIHNMKTYNTDDWLSKWVEPFEEDYVGETYFYEPVPIPIPPLPQSKHISITLPLTQVRDVLKVDVKTKTKQPYTITVHDATGKQTGQWQGQGSTRHTIRASDWLPGSYTLTVSNGTDATAQYFTVNRGW